MVVNENLGLCVKPLPDFSNTPFFLLLRSNLNSVAGNRDSNERIETQKTKKTDFLYLEVIFPSPKNGIKETAGKELTEQLGEDFSGFLGYNPLFESIEVKLYASYTQTDSLQILEKKFLAYPQVKEVFYQKDLVQVINQNIRKISFFVLIIALFVVLSYPLVHRRNKV